MILNQNKSSPTTTDIIAQQTDIVYNFHVGALSCIVSPVRGPDSRNGRTPAKSLLWRAKEQMPGHHFFYSLKILLVSYLLQ